MSPTQAIRQDIYQRINLSTWIDWDARDYLNTYFAKIGADSRETLKFLVRELKRIYISDLDVLDFGSGPTVFAGLAAVPYAKEIHLCDYLYDNLREIKKWIENGPDLYNWDDSIKYILELEGITPTKENIDNRANELRSKATQLIKCDASQSRPLGSQTRKYSLVISNFCADSATASKVEWKNYMRNILNLVSDSGTIILAALRNCSAYKTGERFFPCANIDEVDVKKILLEEHFDHHSFTIEVKDVPDCAPEGFTSLIFACAKRIPMKEIVTEQVANVLQNRNIH